MMRMRTITWLCLLAVLIGARAGGDPSITYNRDGSITLQNAAVSLTVSNRVGAKYGIYKWLFKPTGHEMIDVLYGQTDYVEGHVLGERWDTVEFQGHPAGRPDTGALLVPVSYGVAADGSGARLVQEGSADYRLRREMILRRDVAVLEVRYQLTNLRADPRAFSLRLHSAMSPGARGKYQRKDDTIYLATEAGVLALDQALAQDKYHEQYKNDKFFTAAWKQEPKRAWVWGHLKTPPLTGNWAAQVNRTHGDGAVFVIDEKALLGYYNCPGITLEPVMKATAPRPGETWKATVFLGAFTGAKGTSIEHATPLYVATEALRVEKGRLKGEIIPLFQGTLLIAAEDGPPPLKRRAAPNATVKIDAKLAGKGWTMTALDTKGSRIGTLDHQGAVKLSEPVVQKRKQKRPTVKGDIHIAPGSEKQIRDFIRKGGFTVQCAWAAKEPEKKLAREIAAHLGAGLCWTDPKGKMLVLGTPGDNVIARNVGLLKHSVTTDWPGPGKGAILFYENFEDTEEPVLLLTGSDAAGAAKAAEAFRTRFLKDSEPPTGWVLWPTATDTKVQPYSRPPETVPDRIAVRAARGEYESAQLALTTFEDLWDVEVEVAPLVHAETGKEIDRRYITHYRRRNGPMIVRWVEYYPVDPDNGWTGYPDPLLERPVKVVKGGNSRSIWLTLLVSENAAAGLYRSSITVGAGAKKKTVPIELTVWPFTMPRDGLMGEPYMHLHNFPPENRRELLQRHVQALVINFVEHGMRVIHLGPKDMFRWHFSPEGKYKGVDIDWLVVSKDGKVALDVSRFDWLVDTCDRAANPFQLRYMIYIQSLVHGFGDFRRALPKRFADKPKRDGHWYQGYYAQEMIGLLRRHLERRKLLDRCVLKISDEPRGFDWWWGRFTLAARQAQMPMMTCFNSIDWSQAEKGLGKVALWQPLYMHYNPAFFKKAKQSGALVSWYNCGPPPRITVHTPGAHLRGYLWQAAKADLDIVCWWGIQCWQTHHDVWHSRYSHWNSVVYPAHPQKGPWIKQGKGWRDAPPLDSVRWELIREGMEDANYVVLLRRLIAKAHKAGKTADADAAQKVLDGIWHDVFPTLNDYGPEYARIMQCRRQVAEAIVRLQESLREN